MKGFEMSLPAEPEGVLILFMFGVPVDILARSFATTAANVETAMREAIRKKDSTAVTGPRSIDGEFVRANGAALAR